MVVLYLGLGERDGFMITKEDFMEVRNTLPPPVLLPWPHVRSLCSPERWF